MLCSNHLLMTSEYKSKARHSLTIHFDDIMISAFHFARKLGYLIATLFLQLQLK